jgi:TP901 family phage tail tape measure protein
MALNVRGSDSLMWNTGIDTGGLSRDSAKAKGILLGLTQSISNMDVFAAIGIGAALAFKKAAREAYNFSRDFEHSMLEVSTISQMVANNIDGISDRIVDMSKELPDTAIGLSKALYQIASAGYAGAESFDILEQSSRLAVASVTDTFTAADAITSVMNAYGDAVSGAAEVSDKLFTIVRLGKTTMRELGPDITTVTGLAAQAGITFDELSGIIAESVKTLKTPIAMTGIRGILSAIISPTEQASEKAKELGVNFSIAAVQAQGFESWMKDLIKATGGSTEALSQLFPNIRGLTGLLSIMSDEGNKLSRTMAEIAISAGATDAAFDTMMESTVNQIKILANNVTAKLKPLGDWILKFVGNTAESMNRFFGLMDDELYSVGKNYSSLIALMISKKDTLQSYVDIIDELGKKTKLTEEETYNLETANKRLALSLGVDVTDAMSTAESKANLYNTALMKIQDTNKEIIELQIKLGEIEQSRIETKIKLWNLDKDITSERVRSLENELRSEENRFIRQTGLSTGLQNVPQNMQDYRKEQIKDDLRKIGIEVTDEISNMVNNLFSHGFSELEQADIINKIMSGHVDIQRAKEKIKLATIEQTLEEKRLNLELEQEIENTNKLREILEKPQTTPEKPKGEATEYKKEGTFFPFMGTKASFVEMEQAGKDFDNKLQQRLDSLKSRTGKEVEIHKESLKEILKNTRDMTSQELLVYAKFLEKKAELYKDDEAMRETLLDEAKDAIKKSYDLEIQKIREIGDAFSELGTFVSRFNSDLGVSLSKVSEIASSIVQMQTATTGWGEVSGYAQILNSLWNITGKLSEKIMPVKSTDKSDYYTRSQQALDVLDTQWEDYYLSRKKGEEYLAELQRIVISREVAFQKFKKDWTDQQRLDYLKNIKMLKDELEQALTGTTVTSIADSITDGFMQGLDSAEVFANNFEDLMKQAIFNSFKSKIITNYLESWYIGFAAEMADWGLYGEKEKGEAIESLGEALKSRIEEMAPLFEGLDDIMRKAGFSLTDISGNKATGMAGAISGITEQTAGLLAGQFNAMRVNTANTAAGISNIITYQKRIADNTDYLKSIDNRLMNIEKSNINYTRVIGN